MSQETINDSTSTLCFFSRKLLLDLTQVAVATKTPDGQLLIYLKNSCNPIVLNCEDTQTEAIIASVIGWNHHNVAKNL